MKAQITINNKTYHINFQKPIDISLVLESTEKNPIAWYLEKPEITPVKMGDWIGKVSSKTSSTNFNNITYNPHAHGTHTECLGHITHDFYSINDSLKTFFFTAELITCTPQADPNNPEDLIITKEQLMTALDGKTCEALAIRTLPNGIDKKSRKYSHTNPPFLTEAAAQWLCSQGIQHLLVDLPSVDKEKDGGALLAHKAFWNLKDVEVVNTDARFHSTITELIFVPEEIEDGGYILNLQIPSVANDAVASKPVLYRLSQ